MSASTKKKLRKEQKATAAAQKQQHEAAEAKKLKAYSVVFITTMILVAAIAVGILAVNAVNRSGIIEKNTVALTVNDHDISVADLNYFYYDAISQMYSEWYNEYSDLTALYMQLSLNLDPTAPLGDQYYNEAEGVTSAEYFIDQAIMDAESVYAVYDAAMADPDYELPAEEREALNASLESLDFLATWQGYSSAEEYLFAMYGFGASVDSFSKYSEKLSIARNYAQSHSDSLVYTAEDLDAHEKEHSNLFCSYDYAAYYLPYTNFLTEGTKTESGSVTYTDEQIAQAIADAKSVAESLKYSSVEELNKAIKALAINAENQDVECTIVERESYASAEESIRDWLADDSRKVNDTVVLPYNTKDADGNEVVAGYYALLFLDSHDNDVKMANVRHYLVGFEGGTTDSEGKKVYSDEEKATAKAKAEEVYAEWKSGDATEESFIALVKESTDDSGSKETGGLYEDINPDSNYVPNFLAWALDENRTVGETGIIETEHGYHIMYYVGDSELTYRDHLITEDLRGLDQEAWYNGIIDATTTTNGNLGPIKRDVVMASAN